MNDKRKISTIQMLAESAIMLALSVVLNEFTPIKFPFGGSVTFFSQLPILVIGYRYGIKQGLFTGLAMGVIEMLFGLKNFSYVTGIKGYLILVLADYIIAFSVLGLGAMFKKKIKNQALSLASAGAVVSVLRFICHFISGVTIWGGYAEDQPVWLYSLTYNGGYMLPELIITVVGALAVGSIFDLDSPKLKTLKSEKKSV
ncbi:MAG: energy-coupled thiamine transporter ThiT [Clostridia bacterium]|nr:energy-coupled thiamine transporter ThiT [Clostridia bacterium]